MAGSQHGHAVHLYARHERPLQPASRMARQARLYRAEEEPAQLHDPAKGKILDYLRLSLASAAAVQAAQTAALAASKAVAGQGFSVARPRRRRLRCGPWRPHGATAKAVVTYRSVALFILTDVKITPDTDGAPAAVDGTPRIYDPWNLADGALQPTAYSYNVPG